MTFTCIAFSSLLPLKVEEGFKRVAAHPLLMLPCAVGVGGVGGVWAGAGGVGGGVGGWFGRCAGSCGGRCEGAVREVRGGHVGGRLCRVVQKVWQELCGSCVSVVDLQCVNLHSSSQSLTTLGDLASHMMVVWTNEIQRNIDAWHVLSGKQFLWPNFCVTSIQ